MKKMSLIFAGECIIILCLLVAIGYLIKSDRQQTVNRQAMKGEAVPEIKVEEAVEIEDSNLVASSEAGQKPQGVAVSENSLRQQQDIKTTTEVVERNKKPQIVVFGDSIWNAERGSDGISELIMEHKDVIIYNCSIGGTTAAVYNESTQWDSWTSNSFNGMMYLVTDILEVENLIPQEQAGKVFEEIDFNQVDYIIVSYGLNDYFCDVPIFPKEYYDLTSYVGALRHGVHKIKERYPDIEFILTSPTYCGWFEGERQFNLGAYVEAARGVAEEMDTYFLDMYHALGKNPEEKSEYLEDGVHLNEEGRQMYARSVIDFLEIQGIK